MEGRKWLQVLPFFSLHFLEAITPVLTFVSQQLHKCDKVKIIQTWKFFLTQLCSTPFMCWKEREKPEKVKTKREREIRGSRHVIMGMTMRRVSGGAPPDPVVVKGSGQSSNLSHTSHPTLLWEVGVTPGDKVYTKATGLSSQQQMIFFYGLNFIFSVGRVIFQHSDGAFEGK